MTFSLRLIAAIFACASCIACDDSTQVTEVVDPVERGRGLYEAYCSDCHGKDARGDGPLAAGPAQPPTDLTSIAVRNGDLFIDDAVAAYVDGRRIVAAHGPRDMPVWGRSLDDRNTELGGELRLTDDMIDAIVQYLRTLQRSEGS